MPRRALAWALSALAAARAAGAQTDPAPDEARGSAGLAEAAREGARSFATVRLDRLADMATTDLAPLDDGPSSGGDAPWPDGSAPTETAWERCGLAGPVEPVDLRPGGLLPVQVSLASRGARAVALVAMGRAGPDRRGMAFPESRWVEWGGGRAEVFPSRGFFPGASLALGDRGATVLSYVHPEPRTAAERASRTLDVDVPAALALTRVGPRGAVEYGPNDIEGSSGWTIDSPLVAWRQGTAVVLGHALDAPHERRRREVLHFLDGRGHPARAPLELTDQAVEAGFAEHPAGLAAAPDGRSLAASWAVPDGPIAGVWVRRGITLNARAFVPGTARIADAPPGARRAPEDSWFPRGTWSFRVAQGAGFWGPSVARGGVTFRRTTAATERDAPLAELFFSPWPSERRRAAAQALGAWWDPLVAWSPGGPVVAGLARPRGAPSRALVVAYAARGERSLRTLTVPVEGDAAALAGFGDAVDAALCPTDTGALLAWIDAPSENAERRLELARIACERAAARPAAPARPPAPAAPPPPRPTGRRRGSSSAAGSRD